MQLGKLQAHGCDKIFEEKRSGASRHERDALREALAFIREGDQFVVTRLDRLARSVLDLSQITAEIAAKKVDLVVLDQSIDTGSPTGRLLFHMLAAIGEFERDLIKERAADGIGRALAAGVKFGAKSKLSADQVAALRRLFHISGVDRTQLARRFGISRATLYRLCADDSTNAANQRAAVWTDWFSEFELRRLHENGSFEKGPHDEPPVARLKAIDGSARWLLAELLPGAPNHAF